MMPDKLFGHLKLQQEFWMSNKIYRHNFYIFQQKCPLGNVTMAQKLIREFVNHIRKKARESVLHIRGY